MIIDAHHHLWDTTRREYPWMAAEELAPLRRPYLLDDLRAETTAAGVAHTVLVQTTASDEETEEFLATAAASGGLVAGVVGWLDLTAPDVAERIARLRSGPGGELLVGIRHQVQDEDADWLARPDVRAGVRAVGEAGLAYDLLVLAHQLPAATELVRHLPEMRFVLDHGAKPLISTGALEPWAGDIGELSASPNVTCKLSGLVTEADWSGWDVAGIAPYADHILACFGPGRVMFGSDWPVCELAATYDRVLDLARRLTAGLSEGEREQVFGGNARTVYNLFS
ncbi:amidohydrolase family protein [Sphaerisporangium sp. TRM90804]|uniref:amidohydrolase family protein n=1 Tax=Sphaerisporangium sp. TRM90804 TaxID=3031113 RepID=UPI00244AD7B4|nr:amidohydrolase family protein [Sphaerisporangium sp. TRM90804]MDH2427706.1 amidohydrolase family protein [Sphaerisporangium sp. TRM90804]